MPAPFRLGTWRVQPDRNQLLRGDRVVQLEPRLMQVLVCLAGRAGEVVPRQQLRIVVWGDTIVGEDSLNRAISDLRQALGDDTSTPRYIETIRKVGYRLVAPVTSIPLEGADDVAVRDTIDANGVQTPSRTRPLARMWRPVLALLCITAIVVIVNENRRRTGLTAPRPPVPLTREPGLEVRPALSPDGTRVAFAKKSRKGNQADIFICQRRAESPRQITYHAGYENYPTWSPDGSWLAFVRWTDESSGIFTVPAIGGEPRRVYRTGGFPRRSCFPKAMARDTLSYCCSTCRPTKEPRRF
jgi:DNA-binding winged helix-turn-helix (wHTH) protein